MSFDFVSITVAGTVTGNASVINQDGVPHVLFQMETNVWKRDTRTKMSHMVIYRPVSDRQFNFLREALATGVKVLASGGMEAVVMQPGQPSNALIIAETVQVDASARDNRRAGESASARPLVSAPSPERSLPPVERVPVQHAQVPVPRNDYAPADFGGNAALDFGERPTPTPSRERYRAAPAVVPRPGPTLDF